MLRPTTVLFLAFMAFGCVTNPSGNNEPAGEWVWTNSALYSKADAGLITDAELNHEFVVSKNTCKIQALQLPIPSPSCTQPPKKDCSSMAEGFAKGFCSGYTPGRQCDRTSVVMAQEAQVEIYDSCMTLDGWERKWEPYDVSAEPLDTQIRVGPKTMN